MMLALRKVPSHAGKDVAKIFYEVLEEYSIVNSFGWITTDNASSNDTFIVELQRLLSCNGYELDISGKRVRCLNHIIHLVVEDFLSGVNNEELPTEEEGQVDKPIKKVCRRSKKRRKSDDNSPVFKNLLASIREVAYALSNTSKLGKWEEILEKNAMPRRKIPPDVKTRWNSTFEMLNVAIKYRNEYNLFCNSFNEMEHCSISNSNWEKLIKIKNFLKIFFLLTKFCEGDTYCTIFFSIAAFNSMYDSLDDMDEQELPLKDAINRATKKLKKYYTASDSAPVHLIACILSPCYKMDYFLKNGWENANEIKNM